MPQSLSRVIIHIIFSTKDRDFLRKFGVEFDERFVWD